MKDLFNNNPVTFFLLMLTGILAIVGGVICVISPDVLTIQALLSHLEEFTIALGIMGVGRGIKAAGEKQALAANDVHRDPPMAPVTDEENQRDLHESGVA